MQQEPLTPSALSPWKLSASFATLALPVLLFLDGIGHVGNWTGIDATEHDLVIEYSRTVDLLREDLLRSGRQVRAEERFPRWEAREDGEVLVLLEPALDDQGWPQLSTTGQLQHSQRTLEWKLVPAEDGTRTLYRNAPDGPPSLVAEGITAFEMSDVHGQGASDLSYDAMRYFLGLRRSDVTGRKRTLEATETVNLSNGAFPR